MHAKKIGTGQSGKVIMHKYYLSTKKLTNNKDIMWREIFCVFTHL